MLKVPLPSFLQSDEDHALCAVGGLVESGAVLAAANKISVGMTHFPHLWLVSWWVMAQHSWRLPCCGFRHLPNAFGCEQRRYLGIRPSFFLRHATCLNSRLCGQNNAFVGFVDTRPQIWKLSSFWFVSVLIQTKWVLQ